MRCCNKSSFGNELISTFDFICIHTDKLSAKTHFFPTLRTSENQTFNRFETNFIYFQIITQKHSARFNLFAFCKFAFIRCFLVRFHKWT